MNVIEAPSPNFDARTSPPDILVLHYTGMRTGPEALDRLRDVNPPRVSSHYMVEEDGRIFRLVPEERRAWHAGVSYWKGERNINGVSIGVEIVNPGHEFGYRWSISDARIVGQSAVAPARKDDPGELVPWKTLAEAGHGLWVEAPAAPGAPMREGEESAAVFALQAGFTRLGYDLPPSGKFDADTKAVVTAFQRHWRQHRVDGVADGETRAQLIALLRLAG